MLKTIRWILWNFPLSVGWIGGGLLYLLIRVFA